VGLGELFTNKEKTKNEEVEIKAPAFSVTKITSGIGVAVGGLIGALLAVVPDELKKHPGVVIAAIAAATLIMLGIIVLAAVDMRTRQRAQEAKLRWPPKQEEKDETEAKSPLISEVSLGPWTIQIGPDGQPGGKGVRVKGPLRR
jgi:hypothetical protein